MPQDGLDRDPSHAAATMIRPFSQASDYAIRALTHLAGQEPGTFVLSRQISGELGLPGAFLTKVLQPLVVRGILESQRGRGGGFRLARPAGEILLLEIVDALDPVASRRECLLGQAECSDDRACPLHGYWQASRQAFLEEFERTTLADLVGFCRARPESGYPRLTAGS